MKNSEGVMSPFIPDRFAGTLIRKNILAEHATRAADIINGILVGAESPTVSTDALRAASSTVLENPLQPDTKALRRVLLMPYYSKIKSDRDSMSLQDFYLDVAKSVGSDTVGNPQFVLLGTVEQFNGGKKIGRQDIVKVADASETIHEVTDGMIKGIHQFDNVFPDEVVNVSNLSVNSLSQAREQFATINSVFDSEYASEGLIGRAFYLSNFPNLRSLSEQYLTFNPMWTGVAITPNSTTISMINAVTSEVEFTMIYSTSSLVIANSYLLASWGGFFEGLAKVVEIVVAGGLIGGSTIGGLASSPSIIGPLIAALLIIILLLAMIKKLIDLIEEITGTTAKDKIKKLNDRLKKLLEKINKQLDDARHGRVTKNKAIQDTSDDIKEAKDLIDEMEELDEDGTAGPALDAAKGVIHIVEGALEH